MKRHDWLLIIVTLGFSSLFYKQQAGLNYLLFSCIVCFAFATLHPTLLRLKYWWFYVFCHLICAGCVFYHTSSLSIFAYILSLMVVASKSVSVFQSVLVSVFFSTYAIAASFVYVILDAIKRFGAPNEGSNGGVRLRKILTVSISAVLIVLFFALYQNANPLFKEFTKDINFDWLSVEWCFFTLWGFLIAFGLLKSRILEPIAGADIAYNSTIPKKENYTTGYFDEVVIVKWVFALLNIMLLILNALDAHQLYINPKLPEGITLSDFVHQSIGSLIFSIVLALTFIIVCFRGELNFTEKAKPLKFLIYLWIAQNIVMVISAMVRNSWYVNAYALTYLRIGVFVYLGMALIGLVLTAWKIKTRQRTWALTRMNTEVWFLSLCLSTCVDWDKLIADYNTVHANKFQTVKLDRKYISSFSSTTLPQQILQQPITFHPFTYFASYQQSDNARLSQELMRFYESYKDRSWRSWSLRANRLHESIQNLHNKGLIKTLSLPYYNSPEGILCSYFTQLENLVINASQTNLDSLSQLKALNCLMLIHYSHQDLSPLKTLPNLETLGLSSHLDTPLKGIEALQQLKVLRLSSSSIIDMHQLKMLRNLKILLIENLSPKQKTELEAEFPNLTILSISSPHENYR